MRTQRQLTVPPVCNILCCVAKSVVLVYEMHGPLTKTHWVTDQGLMVKRSYESIHEYGETLQMYEYMYITETEKFI